MSQGRPGVGVGANVGSLEGSPGPSAPLGSPEGPLFPSSDLFPDHKERSKGTTCVDLYWGYLQGTGPHTLADMCTLIKHMLDTHACDTLPPRAPSG